MCVLHLLMLVFLCMLLSTLTLVLWVGHTVHGRRQRRAPRPEASPSQEEGRPGEPPPRHGPRSGAARCFHPLPKGELQFSHGCSSSSSSSSSRSGANRFVSYFVICQILGTTAYTSDDGLRFAWQRERQQLFRLCSGVFVDSGRGGSRFVYRSDQPGGS